jgi:DNA-binding SARP family transcriptional activator
LAGRAGNEEDAEAEPSSRATEEPLARLLSDLTALTTLATSLDADTIFDRLDALLDLVREATGAESSELFLAEPDSGDVLLTAYRGPFRRAFCQIPRFARGEGFPGLATASRRPVVTGDLGADRRFRRELVKAKGFHSYICAPLCQEGGTLGAICLGSRNASAATAETRRFLTWASGPIATALAAGLLRAGRDALPDATWFREDGSPDRLLGEILHRIRRLARADGATLVLRLPGGPVHRVIDGVLAPPTCPYLDGGGTPPGCPVIDDAHGVALFGPRHDWPAACRDLHRHGSVTYCLPLPAGDQHLGILHLAYRDHPPCPPTQQLGPLAQVVSQAGPLVAMAWRAIEQERLAYWPARLDRGGGSPVLTAPGGRTIGETAREAVVERAAGPEPWLRIRCFGDFEIRRDGLLVAPGAFKRRQALTLLKILLTHAGRPVPKEALIEALWPESDPEAASRRLHVVVHALRDVVESDHPHGRTVIQSVGGGYAFDPSVPYWLDVEEFHTAIAAGHRAEADGARTDAVAAYDAAIQLYRGDFCEDDRFAEWCWLEREQLRELFLAVLERLAALRAARGEPDRAIRHLRQIVRVDPLREVVHYRLMEVLLAAGRPAEALQQYEVFRDLLRQELDIEPSAETTALARRVRMSHPR